jgi:protein arginine kinase activator
MLCSVCNKREATVHYTQIVGDKVQKVDLCDTCSKEKEAADPTSFAFADLLLGLGASQEIEQAGEGTQLKCPRCGFTQADFKKSGRLGCADCYETFAGPLEGLLKSMHKGTKHVGKVPQARQQGRDFAARLKALQKDLDKAIADENFEQAAQLRDEIRQTRSKLEELATP